jgi:CBS-domain-containing membrane protein
MVRKIREEFLEVKAYWKNYVFQSLLATGAVFCVLLFLEHGEEVIVASLGATAFVVFALPDSFSAKPRNVLGGHIVGLICGGIGFILLNMLPDPDLFISEAAIHAIAVGLSIFIMVITDTEHPPAAGTALGVAFEGFSLRVVVTVLLFSIVFTVIRLFLKKHLRDLK